MSAPKKYRKKPIVIEAMQILDDLSNHLAIRQWAWDSVGQGDEVPVVMSMGASHMIIRTLEGDMRAEIGDYIIRGVRGEFYPCKSDIFEATYEQAADDRT